MDTSEPLPPPATLRSPPPASDPSDYEKTLPIRDESDSEPPFDRTLAVQEKPAPTPAEGKKPRGQVTAVAVEEKKSSFDRTLVLDPSDAAAAPPAQAPPAQAAFDSTLVIEPPAAAGKPQTSAEKMAALLKTLPLEPQQVMLAGDKNPALAATLPLDPDQAAPVVAPKKAPPPARPAAPPPEPPPTLAKPKRRADTRFAPWGLLIAGVLILTAVIWAMRYLRLHGH